jgi:hypothetical protein
MMKKFWWERMQKSIGEQDQNGEIEIEWGIRISGPGEFQ